MAYLKWYEDNSPVTKSFITGKTLGETGADLDRMFLISSAITKAFHGDGGTYARYTKLGGVQEPENMILSLTPEEQRTFIDALSRQRERSLANVDQTEKLLRRMTGSILSFIDEMGCQPMHLSAEDKAMIAIRDGEWRAFADLLPKVADRQDELLIAAAGRPGRAGQAMVLGLLTSGKAYDQATYKTACQRAVDIGDMERVQGLLMADGPQMKHMEPSFYGEVVQYAYRERKHIAGQLIRQATPEQIAAAPSYLLYQAVTCNDYKSQYALMEKGIDTDDRAADVLHYLCCGHKEYEAESLLRSGLTVKLDNYMALHSCIKNNAPEAAKAVLDQGMDFERYQAWSEQTGFKDGSPETLAAVAQHWETLKQEQAEAQMQEQGETPQTGGMTFG